MAIDNVIRVLYEDRMRLMREGHMMCGYLRIATYDGVSFYGECAIDANRCSFPHTDEKQVCAGCEVFMSLYRKKDY
jgi:hypothetical protein